MMTRYRESSDIHATTPANARGLSDASLREIEARLREIRDAGFLDR